MTDDIKPAESSKSAVHGVVMPSYCEWKKVDNYWDGSHWKTGCDDDWTFLDEDATPKTNGVNFCPMCGKKVVEA